MLHAAAALLGPDVPQALGAADAGGILALLQVLHKVRLADEGAGGGDKLDACVQDGLDRLRTAHAADQDEGDLDLLADGLGLLQILVRSVADHEKGRLDAVVREYIQDLLRVVRPPCGIKGNAAHLLIAFHAVDGQLARRN